MSEPPEMNPDPLAEKLGRLTPSAGFDRDALLFQAGKASAPRSRFWPALAGLLALTQVLTLGLHFDRQSAGPPPAQNVPPPPTPLEAPSPSVPLSDEPARYRRVLLTGDIDELPQPAAGRDTVAAETIWTVRSISSALTID
jgi:hypothetical protein